MVAAARLRRLLVVSFHHRIQHACKTCTDLLFSLFAVCYESSAKFSSMISAHVATKCPDDPSQNTTALDVFSSYCDIEGSKLAEIGGDYFDVLELDWDDLT